VVRDPAGRDLKTLKAVQPVPGSDVRLTIDEDIQYAAEHVLQKTVRTFHAKGATAVVMDPRTGEIYALASVPLVDAKTYGKSGYATRERAITDAYEPGSIFKAVTISGALSEGWSSHPRDSHCRRASRSAAVPFTRQSHAAPHP